MKIRMIAGYYDQPESQQDYFLEPVSFPMSVDADIEHYEQTGEDLRVLQNEWGLHDWADKRFESYEIWDMKIPFDSVSEWPLFHQAWVDEGAEDPEPIGLFMSYEEADKALQKVEEITGGKGRVWHFTPDTYEEWENEELYERFGHHIEPDHGQQSEYTPNWTYKGPERG